MVYTKEQKALHNKVYGKFKKAITDSSEIEYYKQINSCGVCYCALRANEKLFTRNKYNGLMIVCQDHSNSPRTFI